MPNRARLLPFTVLLFVAAACSGPAPAPAERTGAHASSAETVVLPAVCDTQPWASRTRTCGAPTFADGHVTCADLGLAAGGTDVTLTGPATVALDGGYEMRLYLNNPFDVLPDSWAITTTVKPDGTTRTVDAMIIDGAPSGDSLVARFDPPEFYIRNLQVGFAATQIQLCGIRPGRASSLPPPTNATFSLACASTTGSTTPPGAMFPDATAIDYDVTIDPAPPDGTLASVTGRIADGATYGTAYYPIRGGHVKGSDYAKYLTDVTGILELRFTFVNGTCSLYWTLGGEDEGGGGHTW